MTCPGVLGPDQFERLVESVRQFVGRPRVGYNGPIAGSVVCADFKRQIGAAGSAVKPQRLPNMPPKSRANSPMLRASLPVICLIAGVTVSCQPREYAVK